VSVVPDTPDPPEASEARTDLHAPIRALPNGPYLVEDDLRIVWKVPVTSAGGEPIAWRTLTEIAHSTPCVLCRCGGSANKPFCDGTHARKGFDGTDTADDRTRADRAKAYEGDGMVMYDDRSICTHAGFCGTAVTNVWKMIKATGDTNVRIQVAGMVERCPSGALSYALTADAEDAGGGKDTPVDIEPDLPAQIAVTPDGPLWVTGGVPIEASSGHRLEVRNRVTLCRCGESANKPLCDGSHKDIGFVHGPTPPGGA
jgi:CDGSH-type Zn-finger protein